MLNVKAIVILLCACDVALSFRDPILSYSLQRPALIPTEHAGDPLFLTPYIEGNMTGLARELAKVKLDTNIKSYSGFITVNKHYDSNTFFWFFPAENGDTRAPLVIWLQGGPGSSSLYGLFAENGPFYASEDLKLVPRNYSWSRTFSTLFIDNPVGTGFSFTKSAQGYARSEEDVGRDLYAFLLQFFTLFPDMRQNELFITGESYAGKYVPAIAYKIHTENPTAKIKINFKGMAMGNGWTDPASMISYAPYLYQLGLLDREDRKWLMKKEKRLVKLIENKDWLTSAKVCQSLEDDFLNFTGFSSYFNFLQPPPSLTERYFEKYLNQAKVRYGLHVGNLPFNNGSTVQKYMFEDSCKSVKPWVIELLNSGYPVLFYNGQLDIIVAYPLTESFLWSMDDWKLIHEYRHSGRAQWKVDGEVAGYSKVVGNLKQVLVRNSGHMVPMDQPKWGYDLIHRFVTGKSFAN